MEGILLAALKRYVDERYGDASWSALLDEAGLGHKAYVAEERYPDTDLTAIIRAVPAITPVPLSTLVEDFGRFLGPELWQRYRGYGRPEWRTLNLLENIGAVHGAIGAALFGSAPAVLHGRRTSATEVTLVYASPRRLCALAKGIAQGLASSFGESVEIAEPVCMLRRAAACEISVRQVG